VGGAALFAAWGEPSRPGFPRRGNGKGEIRFLAAAGAFAPCSQRRFALLPFALFDGAFAPVPFGVLNINGAAISESNCIAPFPKLSFHRDLAVTRTRRLG
jgi:hypothetical protein